MLGYSATMFVIFWYIFDVILHIAWKGWLHFKYGKMLIFDLFQF